MKKNNPRSGVLYSIYMLLNPLPFGFFVAGWVFDIFYNKTAEVLWAKAAAWCITFGLLFCIIPRFINLFYVWFRPVIEQRRPDVVGFWLYGFAIIAAIFNAFIHSRDAFAIVPANIILSTLTVLLIALHYLYQSTHIQNKLIGE
ncbi:hypothetical protein F971_01324 [Acinetobacter vivianii]|uniref:Uncharacterized protein n=1 Tax=Acinetobacter vivianii TaxID=1776742 RepID=N8V094_9GAMM|nr:hypothetical protein [Acinetobacter vivianii]ENU93276.1 hypothetical protein F971_01324 [Acinetobacter vivianii]